MRANKEKKKPEKPKAAYYMAPVLVKTGRRKAPHRLTRRQTTVRCALLCLCPDHPSRSTTKN